MTLSQVPANYLEVLLLTNPSAQSFQISGVNYTRAQILAQFNTIADPSESTVKVVGLQTVPSAPVAQVLTRAAVK
jgi:hypothetical protein